MRRVIFVVLLSTTAQFGFTAAQASSGARPMIDELFESSFPKEEAPPPPAPPASNNAGDSGQSVSAPSMPDIEVPKPKVEKAVSAERVKPVAMGAGSTADKLAAVEARLEQDDEPEAEPEEAPEPRATRSTAEERAGARRVSSTAYCLTGTMASGRRTYWGAAAMNGTPLGSRYQVLDGPRAGETFVIEDRIGHSSAFDIAYPGDCRGAYSYGRRTISIRPV